MGGPKTVHGACWAHARRKFFEAAKLNLIGEARRKGRREGPKPQGLRPRVDVTGPSLPREFRCQLCACFLAPFQKAAGSDAKFLIGCRPGFDRIRPAAKLYRIPLPREVALPS